MERKRKNINLEQIFCVHHRVISALKRIDFFSDRILYIVLGNMWCNISVLNVLAK